MITLEQLKALPHFTEEDATKIMQSINWIAGGGRDRYNAREELLNKFKDWGREISTRLKEECKAFHYNTSYSSWEYKVKGARHITIQVYYTWPIGNEDIRITTEDDFAFRMLSRTSNGEFEAKTWVKTIEEAKSFIEKYSNREYPTTTEVV